MIQPKIIIKAKGDTGWRTLTNDTKVHFGADGVVDKGPPVLVGKHPKDWPSHAAAFGSPTTTHPAAARDKLRGAIKSGKSEHADQLADLAEVADKSQWLEWADKLTTLSPPEAEAAHSELKAAAKEATRLHWLGVVNNRAKRAFKKQGHAAGMVDSDTITPSQTSPVPTHGDTEKYGKMLGGVAKQYPIIQALLDKGFVKSVRPATHPGGDGHAASWDSGHIEIANGKHVGARTLIHEIGHGLEAHMPDWAAAQHWIGKDAPNASEYGGMNPAEAIAEAFLEMVAGDHNGFASHAPQQVADIKVAFEKATGKSWADISAAKITKSHGGPFIGPHGGKWADSKHTVAWKADDPHMARQIHALHPTLFTTAAHDVYAAAGGTMSRHEWRPHYLAAVAQSGTQPPAAQPQPKLWSAPKSPKAPVDPNSVTVYGKTPMTPGTPLNGIPLGPVANPEFWAAHVDVDVGETPLVPSLDADGEPRRAASGVVVFEPDGRVWLVEPTDHFGGYQQTMPKGGVDDGLTPQQNALKEAYEESGLQVEITGWVGDFEGDTSTTRYYLATRVGGQPSDAGWETAAVKLAEPHAAAQMLNRRRDRNVLNAALVEMGRQPIPETSVKSPFFQDLHAKLQELEASPMSAFAKAIPDLLEQSKRRIYEKRQWRGLKISIENPQGSTRHWFNPDNGKSGVSIMHYPYGYFRLTTDADGDHVDVYIGPYPDTAKEVYVVRQTQAPGFKTFDENKCMIGFNSLADAKMAYLGQYDEPRFLGPIDTYDATVFAEALRDTGEVPDTPKQGSKLSAGPKIVMKGTVTGDLGKSLGGPFVGPHGGQWADAKHTISWQPDDPHGAKAIHGLHPHLSTAKAHQIYVAAGGTHQLSKWQHHHIAAKKAAAQHGTGSAPSGPAPAHTSAPAPTFSAAVGATVNSGVHLLKLPIGAAVKGVNGVTWLKVGADSWQVPGMALTLPAMSLDGILIGGIVVAPPVSPTAQPVPGETIVPAQAAALEIGTVLASLSGAHYTKQADGLWHSADGTKTYGHSETNGWKLVTVGTGVAQNNFATMPVAVTQADWPGAFNSAPVGAVVGKSGGMFVKIDSYGWVSKNSGKVYTASEMLSFGHTIPVDASNNYVGPIEPQAATFVPMPVAVTQADWPGAFNSAPVGAVATGDHGKKYVKQPDGLWLSQSNGWQVFHADHLVVTMNATVPVDGAANYAGPVLLPAAPHVGQTVTAAMVTALPIGTTLKYGSFEAVKTSDNVWTESDGSTYADAEWHGGEIASLPTAAAPAQPVGPLQTIALSGIAPTPADPHMAHQIHAKHGVGNTAAHQIYLQHGGTQPLSQWQHHYIKAKKATGAAVTPAVTASGTPIPPVVVPGHVGPVPAAVVPNPGDPATPAIAAALPIGSKIRTGPGESSLWVKTAAKIWTTVNGGHLTDTDFTSPHHVVEQVGPTPPPAAAQPSPNNFATMPQPDGTILTSKAHLDGLPPITMIHQVLVGGSTVEFWKQSDGMWLGPVGAAVTTDALISSNGTLVAGPPPATTVANVAVATPPPAVAPSQPKTPQQVEAALAGIGGGLWTATNGDKRIYFNALHKKVGATAAALKGVKVYADLKDGKLYLKDGFTPPVALTVSTHPQAAALLAYLQPHVDIATAPSANNFGTMPAATPAAATAQHTVGQALTAATAVTAPIGTQVLAPNGIVWTKIDLSLWESPTGITIDDDTTMAGDTIQSVGGVTAPSAALVPVYHQIATEEQAAAMPIGAVVKLFGNTYVKTHPGLWKSSTDEAADDDVVTGTVQSHGPDWTKPKPGDKPTSKDNFVTMPVGTKVETDAGVVYTKQADGDWSSPAYVGMTAMSIEFSTMVKLGSTKFTVVASNPAPTHHVGQFMTAAIAASAPIGTTAGSGGSTIWTKIAPDQWQANSNNAIISDTTMYGDTIYTVGTGTAAVSPSPTHHVGQVLTISTAVSAPIGTTAGSGGSTIWTKIAPNQWKTSSTLAVIGDSMMYGEKIYTVGTGTVAVATPAAPAAPAAPVQTTVSGTPIPAVVIPKSSKKPGEVVGASVTKNKLPVGSVLQNSIGTYLKQADSTWLKTAAFTGQAVGSVINAPPKGNCTIQHIGGTDLSKAKFGMATSKAAPIGTEVTIKNGEIFTKVGPDEWLTPSSTVSVSWSHIYGEKPKFTKLPWHGANNFGTMPVGTGAAPPHAVGTKMSKQDLDALPVGAKCTGVMSGNIYTKMADGTWKDATSVFTQLSQAMFEFLSVPGQTSGGSTATAAAQQPAIGSTITQAAVVALPVGSVLSTGGFNYTKSAVDKWVSLLTGDAYNDIVLGNSAPKLVSIGGGAPAAATPAPVPPPGVLPTTATGPKVTDLAHATSLPTGTKVKTLWGGEWTKQANGKWTKPGTTKTASAAFVVGLELADVPVPVAPAAAATIAPAPTLGVLPTTATWPADKVLTAANIASITQSSGTATVTLTNGATKTLSAGNAGGIKTDGLTQHDFVVIRALQLKQGYHTFPAIDETFAKAKAQQEWNSFNTATTGSTATSSSYGGYGSGKINADDGFAPSSTLKFGSDDPAPNVVNDKVAFAKFYDPTKALLNSTDKAVIAKYTGSWGYGSNSINQRMRKAATGGAPISASDKSSVAELKLALTKAAITQPITVFRGASLSEHPIGKMASAGILAIGAVYTDPGFQSASVRIDGAFGGGLVLEMMCPAGTPAAYVGTGHGSPLSVCAGEDELLVNAGTKLRVVGYRIQNGNHVVRCEVVP